MVAMTKQIAEIAAAIKNPVKSGRSKTPREAAVRTWTPKANIPTPRKTPPRIKYSGFTEPVPRYCSSSS